MLDMSLAVVLKWPQQQLDHAEHNLRRQGVELQPQLDSDPDVCRIAPKMLWIHHLVGVSHFADCRENRSVTMRNL